MNIQSDITILDNLLALNLDISLWSARKKMMPEDLGGAELPPEDLASLGSKRIADPETLTIFGTLKSRAFSFIDRHGVRFMSGWAIPEDKAEMIVEKLIEIKSEFMKAKDDYLNDYEASLDAWINKHKEWAGIIKNSIVSSDYVRNRMNFRWQLYKVAPFMGESTAVTESGLAEEVTGLGNTLYDEVAQSADEIWKKVYMGKTTVTHKALSPLKTLHDKLVGLTFVEPHVAPVADIIQTALKRVNPKGNIVGSDLLMLQGLVCLLKDSENLILHSQKLIEGYGPATVLDALLENAKALPVDSVKEEPTKPVVNRNPEPILTAPNLKPVLPELPPVTTRINIPSMGLW